MRPFPLLMIILLVAACGGKVGRGQTEPAFASIPAGERIEIAGTEPFWAITAEDGELTYKTPQRRDGDTIAARRFAGRGGLSLSGTLDGQPLDVMVTQGACTDGMSDARYPYTATLRIGEAQHAGCAWTASHAPVHAAQGAGA